MTLAKDKMTTYQRERRSKLKKEVVVVPCSECAKLKAEIKSLQDKLALAEKAPKKKELKALPAYSRPSHHSLTCKCMMCKPPL